MIGSVLYSDITPPQEDDFIGYAFVGHDYVVGRDGAQSYTNATGAKVNGGHDGCYLVVCNEGNSHVFDTDYAGFRTLFYYSDGQRWVVSDSWILIVDHLRKRNIRIRPNYSALLASTRLTSLQQLSTFETPAHGISLLPLHNELVVRDGSVLVRPRRTRADKSDEPATYEDAMHQVVALWVGRFKTLLAHDSVINLRVDLSGGLDSRVIFAMYVAASRALKNEGRRQQSLPKIVSGTGPNSLRDLEVATLVAETFGMTLNDAQVFEQSNLSSSERFARWREAYLGTYHPVYIPSVHPRGGVVQFGGIGSENHRGFYQGLFGYISVESFVARHASRFDSKVFGDDYRSALEETFAKFDYSYSDDELIAEHYRQFRSRLHGGVHSQARVTFSPFSSEGFDAARQLGGPVRFEQAQMNYDTLSLLEPSLLEIDFDDAKKKPSEDVRDLLLTGPLSARVSTGRVYGSLSRSLYDVDHPNESETSLTEIMESQFAEAVHDDFVAGVLPNDLIVQAKEQMEHFRESGRFARAGQALAVSVVLTARAVSPNVKRFREG